VTNGVDYTPWRTTPCILPPRPPDAAFEATPVSGEAPLAVSFFNISGGAVTNSQWAFGDGGTSTELNPIHVYTQPGVYSVTLTVNGPAGDDAVTNTAYIQVDATTYRMFAPVIVRPRR
jgi:PKD repeat protein